MPIRESTYDHYHNQPPLDTVIKDLVFRIDPPLLENVIQERFKYMVRSIESEKKIFHYYTSNSLKVQVKKEDVESYLRCIINALFQNNFFKKLLTGLAGRNIRKGIEIFLDICKSGYISEDFILKVKEKGGNYRLQHHILTRILLRGKRKYYHDAHSRIKNLFYSDQEDTLPDPLVRLSILRWMEKEKKTKGPNGVLGYHKIKTILKDLVALGHDESRVLEEVGKLVKAECLMTESLDTHIEENETISITPKGTIHLDLLKNIDYLSTVSEDTYFKNSQISKAIANNIKGGAENHLSKQSAFENSRYLISYLQNYKEQIIIAPEKFLSNGDLKELVTLDAIEESLKKKISSNSDVIDPIKLKEKFPPGTKVSAEITGVQDYGLFVEFGGNAVGFIDKKKIKEFSPEENLSKYFKKGQIIKITLGDYQEEHRKFDCNIVHGEIQKNLFQ